MAEEATIDETAGFEVASEDTIETMTEQGTETTEEQASSEEVETDEVVEEKVEEAVEAESSDSVESVEEEKSGDETTANNSGDKPKGVQKRINKVIKEREEAKREAEKLKREIEELKGNKETTKSDEVSEPKESDFDTYDEYLDAVDSHAEKSKETKPKDVQSKNEDDSGLTDSQKTALAVIDEAIEGAEKPDDFNAVAYADDVAITGEMLEAIADCENPAKVMYHLGKNKDLAKEISKGTNVQQIKAIDAIDKSSVKPPKPIQTTKAKDVIDPVKGVDFQGKTHQEMNFNEYEKSRSKSKSNDGW